MKRLFVFGLFWVVGVLALTPLVACGSDDSGSGGGGGGGSCTTSCPNGTDDCPSIACDCPSGVVNAKSCVNGCCADKQTTCDGVCN